MDIEATLASRPGLSGSCCRHCNAYRSATIARAAALPDSGSPGISLTEYKVGAFTDFIGLVSGAATRDKSYLHI